MSTNLMFSIIIPAFKKKYFKECLDSILSQTYQLFEIVIVDDASPDDLKSIVGLYDDPRIKFFRNKTNCGVINVVDNWNQCLEYACGDYVICMGDDDKLLTNCLEEYNNLIHLYPGRHLYHAWTEIINEESEIIGLQEPRPLCESVYSMIWNRWNGRIQFIGDFLFEIQFLRSNGGFFKLPSAWASDDISSFIIAKEKGVVNSQIPLFQYRINSINISATTSSSSKLSAIQSERAWYECFLKEIPQNDLDQIYRKMIIQTLPKHFKKKIMSEVEVDMRSGFIRKAFHYFIHRNKYALSFKELLYIFFSLFKNKQAQLMYK